MRLPILQHDCSDLEIEYKGGSYKPHDGEDVWFIPHSPADDALTILELANAEDQAAVLGKLIHEICPILARAIDSWSWTDPRTEKPIGTKDGKRTRPSAEDIGSLHYEEIVYLVNSFFEETQPETNPQSASLEES